MGKMSGDLLIVVLACSPEVRIMFLKSFEYFQEVIKSSRALPGSGCHSD